MVSFEKAFDAQLAKKKRAEDLRNGLADAGVERGEGETISSMEVVAYVIAAFAVIVMFSFTVVVLFCGEEGNEDVLNLRWVFGKLGWRGSIVV